MTKRDFEHGTADIDQFFAWVNERHRIWVRRNAGQPKPWTEDPIMREFKFTNVFRELDKGTLALRAMIRPDADPGLIAWNILWYRSFNRFEHATDIGWCADPRELIARMIRVDVAGKRIFTSAHMTVGRAGERKIDTVLEAMRDAFDLRDELCSGPTLEAAFNQFPRVYGVGRFITYEVVSDFRWYPSLWPNGGPTDVLTWANIGPGCKRGLQRLGMPIELSSLTQIWDSAPDFLAPWIRDHHAYCGAVQEYPPFELREIEHSLCEFDKYQRGHPKERYDGRA